MSSPAAPYRVALIGFGKAGAGIHAPLIAATPGLQVTAIVTADPLRSAAAEQRCPGAQVVASVEQLWQLGDAFDTVVVASPHAHHVEAATAALERGLATVVDKPLGRTYDEAAPLLQLAARTGAPLTAFHNRRWDTDFLTAVATVRAGLLGDVVRWESRFDRWRPTVAGGWRENAPDQGGGLLLDLLTHLVDQAVVALGPVASVYAELNCVRPGSQAEDDVLVVLRHTGGAQSTLWAGVLAAAPAPRLRVVGTRASLHKDGLDWQEDALKVAGSASALQGPAPDGQGGLLYDGQQAVPLAAATGSWLEFYRLWERTLRLGEPVPVRAEDALAVLRVTDAARASAREQRIVHLSG